jgi:hypothetical protein
VEQGREPALRELRRELKGHKVWPGFQSNQRRGWPQDSKAAPQDAKSTGHRLLRDSVSQGYSWLIKGRVTDQLGKRLLYVMDVIILNLDIVYWNTKKVYITKGTTESKLAMIRN